MFRDAGRIGQIAVAGAAGPQQHAILEEALCYFDQATAIRLSNASLARLSGGPLSHFAAEAQRALSAGDTQSISRVARDLGDASSPQDALTRAAAGALVLTGKVIDAARHAFEPAPEKLA
jgi:hypothetical protein